MPFKMNHRPRLLGCQDSTSRLTIPSLNNHDMLHPLRRSSIPKNKGGSERRRRKTPQRGGAEDRAGSLKMSDAVRQRGVDT